MLKLTRLLHFHQPHRIDLIDYYERTLFNQMLGEQDPRSAHGFNIYYTGLSPAAFKRQPPFMGSDPDVYSTNYHNFSCDDGTGMETQAKFADTIYSRDRHGLFVNLFIPSEVTWGDNRMRIRQETRFPDEPGTRLTVLAGHARIALRVRIPGWAAAPARAWLNGRELTGRELTGTAAPGSWLVLDRAWSPGDTLRVSLPMELAGQPHPGPAGRAGGDLRAGRAQRRLWRSGRHADAPAGHRVADPDVAAAAGLPGAGGRARRPAHPDRPDAAPALQHVLEHVVADLGWAAPGRAGSGPARSR